MTEPYYEPNLTARLEHQELHDRLETAMLPLSSRERTVLHARLWEGLTLQAIANQLGVGRERIRQIEAKALRRLQLRAGSLRLTQFV